MKNSVLYFTLICFLRVGCDSQEVNLEQQNPPADNNNGSKLSLETNNDRSLLNFDFYGTSHNQAMDYVATLPNFATATLPEISNFGNTYSDPHFDDQNCRCDS